MIARLQDYRIAIRLFIHPPLILRYCSYIISSSPQLPSFIVILFVIFSSLLSYPTISRSFDILLHLFPFALSVPSLRFAWFSFVHCHLFRILSIVKDPLFSSLLLVSSRVRLFSADTTVQTKPGINHRQRFKD